MKLGIAVVYLVSEENEQLLDLHLEQIEHHTQVPYTIYACANRLLPHLRDRLKQHPKVKICPCPPTEHRRAEEHSHYLQHLVEAAIADGASHVVTLHVDSFPVQTGWAQALAAKLTDSCVLATVDDAFTACLFFSRDFYLRYQPAFLLSEEERASPTYRDYDRQFHHIPHSGIGYTYKVYTEGLSWYTLQTTNYRIYGDVIYHFGSAILRTIDRAKPMKSRPYMLGASIIRMLKKMRRVIPMHLETKVAKKGLGLQARRMEMAHLLDDFEGYMKTLRASNVNHT